MDSTLSEGTVSQTPASVSDPLQVIIPPFTDHSYACPWIPHDPMPQKGDRCLVARPQGDSDERWVVAYGPFVAAATAPPPPLGSMMDYAGASDPSSSWVVADGRALNATADPTLLPLFNIIGATYGGTGQTNFFLPDTKGRTTIGSGTGSGLTARTRGAKGGTEPSNMPSHTHVMQMAHNIASSPWDVNIPAQGSSQNAGVVNASTDPTGGGADNMMPFLAMPKIIRIR